MQIEWQGAAGQESCGTPSIMSLARCKNYAKNTRHIKTPGRPVIKLEVQTTGVLLLFGVKSIIQEEAFINFSLIFFS